MRAFTIFSIWIVTLQGLAAGAGPPGLADDAYHFPQFQNGAHDASFAEWWYFNLIDEEQDLRFVVGYSIFAPASPFATAAVTALAFTGEEPASVTESFPVSAFSASVERADVAIAANTIEVDDSGAYRITGSLAGGHSIEWWLNYVPTAAPWLGADDERVGILPWERMSWLNFMPGATVEGWVAIDGHTYTVAGDAGYHDHNWGEWIPTEVVWNWAQYQEPGFSLGLGDFRNRPVGVVGIELDGERVRFERHQYVLLHTQWGLDPRTLLPIPTRSRLQASNGQVKLVAIIDVGETEALFAPQELPFLLFEPVIYEQTATFSGSVWRRPPGGAWTLARSFDGEGFREFTGRVPAHP